MKSLSRIVLSLCASCMLIFTACKESALVPYDNIPAEIQQYFAQKWIVNLPSSTTDHAVQGWILDFQKNGRYVSSSPNALTTHGSWKYNAVDTSVTLSPDDGSSSSTFRILSITKQSIALKNTNSSTTLNFDSQEGSLFTISGPIVFEKNLRIPKNPTLAVFWKAAGDVDSYFIWGKGTIDELTNSYTLKFDSYPPDSLIAKFYGCDGKVGVGSIYLYSDASASTDGQDFRGWVPLNTVGTVRNKSLIFLFGRFDAQNCLTNVPWVNSFRGGFNLGDAVSTSPTSGYYEPSRSGDAAPLVITDDLSSYVTPIWWR